MARYQYADMLGLIDLGPIVEYAASFDPIPNIEGVPLIQRHCGNDGRFYLFDWYWHGCNGETP